MIKKIFATYVCVIALASLVPLTSTVAQTTLPTGNGTVSDAPAQNAPNTGIVYECAPKMKGNVEVYGECDFNDLIRAVQKIVKWLTIFSIEMSVVVIAYAGFTYMTSGGNPGQIKKANTMFLRVAQGLGFIIAAWLIVNLIANALIQNPDVPKILIN